MTLETSLEIADAYLNALRSRDFELARSCLSDHRFEYRSPIFNCDDADEFAANISAMGSIVERIELRQCFVDGDEICQILKFITVMSSVNTTDVVQWISVKQGKIVSIEAFFDGRVYREMFSPDPG